MAGIIHGWWSRAKRDTTERASYDKAAEQENEWRRHLEKRAAAEELKADLERAQDEADREARREAEWLTKWLRKKMKEEVPWSPSDPAQAERVRTYEDSWNM